MVMTTVMHDLRNRSQCASRALQGLASSCISITSLQITTRCVIRANIRQVMSLVVRLLLLLRLVDAILSTSQTWSAIVSRFRHMGLALVLLLHGTAVVQHLPSFGIVALPIMIVCVTTFLITRCHHLNPTLVLMMGILSEIRRLSLHIVQ